MDVIGHEFESDNVMLKVLITVDTEVYPLFADWRSDHLSRDIQRDIYGETPSGNYGLNYQVEILSRYGLKAVFFVEGLFANAVGIEPLRTIVRQINEGGHEVQLHLHPEWLAWMAESPVKAEGRWMTNQFTASEQADLIVLGLHNLKAAGAERISAFRAGDYAANADTLTALQQSGIPFDTSYNACYNVSFADVDDFRDITQPKQFGGVCEVPVSYWSTWPFGRRHAQFTGSSLGELRSALEHSEQSGWHSFVIVSHSFELLKKRRQRINSPVHDPIVASRFVELCRFLHDHADRFQTCGFNDLSIDEMRHFAQKAPYVSPAYRTAYRVLQQAYRRLT